MTGWLIGGGLVVLLFLAPLIGLFSMPWAPFWFGQRGALAGGATFEPVTGQVPGTVSDVERYELALAAGWNASDAVTATAISFAENGSGNPAAMSGRNSNGTFDLGMWQVNSQWWDQFGGADALKIPLNNARAAHTIYLRQSWCAWSTYLVTCGPGHTGSYLAFLSRAQSAALRSMH